MTEPARLTPLLPDAAEERLLNVDELARLIGCKRDVVYAYQNRTDALNLPYFMVGGRRKTRYSAYLAWIVRCEHHQK